MTFTTTKRLDTRPSSVRLWARCSLVRCWNSLIQGTLWEEEVTVLKIGKSAAATAGTNNVAVRSRYAADLAAGVRTAGEASVGARLLKPTILIREDSERQSVYQFEAAKISTPWAVQRSAICTSTRCTSRARGALRSSVLILVHSSMVNLRKVCSIILRRTGATENERMPTPT